MDFIDRHRPVRLSGLFRTSPQPSTVLPDVLARIAHDGGIVRRTLKVRPVGIGLRMHRAGLITDQELVEFTLLESGHKQFPDTGSTQGAHRMVAPVPVVEIPRHRNLRGIWGPDGKRHPVHAVHRAQMRAELFVDAVFGAFVEQIQVLRPERRQESIGVKKLPQFPAPVLDAQQITKHLSPTGNKHLEHAGLIQPGHCPGFAPARIDHRATHRLAHQGPHDEAALTSLHAGVHAEHGMRSGVPGVQQGVEF